MARIALGLDADSASCPDVHTHQPRLATSIVLNNREQFLTLIKTNLLGLNSKLPHGEVRLSLLLLLRHSSGILGRESSADGSSLLGSEVEWEVLLALVEDSELVSLVGVDDCEGSGDRLAQVMSASGLLAPCCSFPAFAIRHVHTFLSIC